MLKFSICVVVLLANCLITQAQIPADYSESATPAAREFKVTEIQKGF